MRPCKLTITGFGPFSSRQDIDFSRFDDIFLITGKTGSGKSTIFDAMMYALYGVLPGTRDIRSALSDYKTEELEPAVDFTFSIQGAQYRVYRTLPYARPSKRGSDRLIEVPTTVNLHKKSGNTWSHQEGTATEINNTIENLLRLTAEEFSKIVLLPQGEFQRFLVSDTKEKKVLLEKLFPTERHHQITELLKERTRDIKKELSLKSDERLRTLKVFNPETYKKDIAAFQKNLKDTGKSLLETKKMMNTVTEELARAFEKEKDFIEHDKTLTEYQLLIEKDEVITLLQKKTHIARELLSIAPLMQNHKELMAECKKLEQKINVLRKNIEQEDEQLKKITEISKEIPVLEKTIDRETEELGRLNALLPKIEKLQSTEKRHADYKSSLKALQNDFKQLQKNQKELIHKRDETRKKAASCEKDLLIYEDVIKKLAKAESVYQKLQDIQNRQSKLKALKNSIESMEKELHEQTGQLASLHLEAASLLSKKHTSLASTLAAELKENEPCPVCGSVSHPSPASSGLASFDEEELLKAASEKIISLEKNSTALNERIHVSREQYESVRHEVKELAQKTPQEPHDVELQIESLKKEKNRLDAVKEDLVNAREHNKEYDTLLEQVSGQYQAADSAIKEDTIKIDNLEQEINSLKEECGDPVALLSRIKAIQQNLGSSKKKIQSIETDKKKSEMAIESLKKELVINSETYESSVKKADTLIATINDELNARDISSIEEAATLYLDKKSIENNDTSIKDYMDKKKSLETTLDFISKKIHTITRPDINSLEEKKRELTEKIKKLEENRDALSLQVRDITAQSQKLNDIEKEIEKLTTDSQAIVELSNDLSGKNPRNLTFQNFILGAYLEEVAAYASQRLHTMSEGRYDLLVNEEISHGNREAGLDLDVFDAFTGQKRSVKSLSGGEKFLASIALALGLADVIQARSGGIELDAIFIDEGFGSLDDAALDRALSVLDTIRDNRLVGIISHVSELRTRIPSQINIIKENSGSRISY